MKAFFGKKELTLIQERYLALKEKLLKEDPSSRTFRKKALFCLCDPSIGLIEDYLKKRFVSSISARTALYLIRIATYLSLDREKEFKEDNEPLLEDSAAYLRLAYQNDLLDEEERRKEELKKKFVSKCSEDLRFAKAPQRNEEPDLEIPFLLNCSLDELTRAFLGYLYADQAEYLKKRCGDGKFSELEEKYGITYFNDDSRMLNQILVQTGSEETSPLKNSQSGYALSMKNNNKSMENVVKRVLLKVGKISRNSALERILLQLRTLEASRIGDISLGLTGRRYIFLQEKLLLLFRLFALRKEVRTLLSPEEEDFLPSLNAPELLKEAYGLSSSVKTDLKKVFLYAGPNFVSLEVPEEEYVSLEESVISVEKAVYRDVEETLKEILPLKIELEGAEEILSQRETVFMSRRRKRK